MWKSFIKGYEISSTGKVKNSETNKLLKLEKNSKGYLRVNIRRKHFFIHKLVAQAFIPNPLHLPQVTFKTSDKENVTMENLKWCYNTYCNTQLSARHQLKGNIKVTQGMITAMKWNKRMTVKECAKLYNVSVSTIYAVRKGKNIKRFAQNDTGNIDSKQNY